MGSTEWSMRMEVAIERIPAKRLEKIAEALAGGLAAAYGSVSYGNGRLGARVSVDAGSFRDALEEGFGLIVKQLVSAGLPNIDPVHVEVQTAEELDRSNAEPNMPELLGVAEVAKLLGVSRQRASELATSSLFPSPVAHLASGPVWVRPAVARHVGSWDRKPGRPPKFEAVGTRAIRVRGVLKASDAEPLSEVFRRSCPSTLHLDGLHGIEPGGIAVLRSLARESSDRGGISLHVRPGPVLEALKSAGLHEGANDEDWIAIWTTESA